MDVDGRMRIGIKDAGRRCYEERSACLKRNLWSFCRLAKMGEVASMRLWHLLAKIYCIAISIVLMTIATIMLLWY